PKRGVAHVGRGAQYIDRGRDRASRRRRDKRVLAVRETSRRRHRAAERTSRDAVLEAWVEGPRRPGGGHRPSEGGRRPAAERRERKRWHDRGRPEVLDN